MERIRWRLSVTLPELIGSEGMFTKTIGPYAQASTSAAFAVDVQSGHSKAERERSRQLKITIGSTAECYGMFQ